MSDENDWQLDQRAGSVFLWRFCECDEWESESVPSGTTHLRERVPNAPVEICYFADTTTKTVTVLRIRTMPVPSDPSGTSE